MLEITLKTPTGFLAPFAKLIGSKVENGLVRIPPQKGSGYLQGFMLGASMGVMIRNYELNDDLLSRRLASPQANERIVMSFNNVFHKKGDISTGSSPAIKDLPSVQMGKGNIDFEAVYPSKTKFRSIVIAIDTDSLLNLLEANKENSFFRTILSNDQPLFFEELISPAIQKVTQEIVDAIVPAELQRTYIRIKSEELICLLFVELLKRERTPMHALHANDVESIYRIRDLMLSSLEKPPVLEELARMANMSESKLKRLFKQIFGNSVFNYYQRFRMQEAARLLRENKLSVSEVGYQMGFTNLGHFTRVFEEHIGTKPKKFALSQCHIY